MIKEMRLMTKEIRLAISNSRLTINHSRSTTNYSHSTTNQISLTGSLYALNIKRFRLNSFPRDLNFITIAMSQAAATAKSRCFALTSIELFDIAVIISLIFAQSDCSAKRCVKVFTHLFIVKSKGYFVAVH